MNKFLKRTLTYTTLFLAACGLGSISTHIHAQTASTITAGKDNSLQQRNNNTVNNSNYRKSPNNTISTHMNNHNTSTTIQNRYNTQRNEANQNTHISKQLKHHMTVNQINMKNAQSLPLLKINKTTYSDDMVNNKLQLSNNAIKKGTLIKPNNMVQTHKHIYFNAYRMGHNIGWVKSSDLNRTNYYEIPYKYTSQFWPSKAKDACEIASLKTAMSADGKTSNIPLNTMVSKIPLTPNANFGYTGNPFHYGTHASIYPPAMVNISKEYGVPAKVLTGKSDKTFIYYVTHGDPVVYESPFMMKRPESDHDLTIVGYKPGYFYVVDPFSAYRSSRRATWVSINRFNYLFKSNKRNQHALTILTK